MRREFDPLGSPWFEPIAPVQTPGEGGIPASPPPSPNFHPSPLPPRLDQLWGFPFRFLDAVPRWVREASIRGCIIWEGHTSIWGVDALSCPV